MLRSTTSRKGFTLVEFLIYIALAGAFATIVSSLLYELIETNAKNRIVSDVEQEGMLVMRRLLEAIRNASSTQSPATQATSTVLSLTAYAPGANPTVFDLAGGALRVTEGAGAAVALTSSQTTASALLFSNYAQSATTTASLRVQFTLTHVNPSGRASYDFTKTFSGSASKRNP